mmetsp:Transcript_8217/g.23469  ORF Transcript_8217/g.23469 Transcript_8217/m.23469 type:complete len:296 (-) Transcript_8217:1560-2447(-)
MMNGQSSMVNICRSLRIASCRLCSTMCCLYTVFRANNCEVIGSRSSVTRPKAPRPRTPTRFKVRLAAAGSSCTSSTVSIADCTAASLLRCLRGVRPLLEVSKSNRERKPPSKILAFFAFLYFANSIKSSSAALRKSSADKWPASSRNVGPSRTKHSTSGEFTRTENSEGRLRNSARSPKCCEDSKLAKTSSSAPVSEPLVMTHSPLVMMYQASCFSPSWMSTSPCLNLAVRKFCAISIFSCISKPWSKSTSPICFTMRSICACWKLHMMRRNCAWLTHQTTESSQATAVDVRGAW